MDLKTLGIEVAKLGLPLLGGALAGPEGAAIGVTLAGHIGSATSNPDTLLADLANNAAALAKAREFETLNKTHLAEVAVKQQIAMRQADSNDLAAVNNTMTAEANNAAYENGFQKGWRPLNGYVVGVVSAFCAIFDTYLCYLGIIGHDPSALNALPAIAMAQASILAIPGAAAGITAWHRGVAQVEAVKNGGGV